MKNKYLISGVPLLVAFSMFILTLTLFYPGGMSGDSVGQLRQVILWEISTWHPPSMIYMWKAWSYIFPGPFGMLFFHALIYWIAIYLFLTTCFRSILARSGGIILLGIFPSTWVLVGTIWKDTGMLVSFFLSLSIIITIDTYKKGKFFLLLSFFFLIYGISVRHNALIASFPVILLLISTARPRLKKLTIFCLAFLVITVFAIAIPLANKKMAHKVDHNLSNSIFFWDLWGMSIDQNKNLMPNYLFHRNLKTHSSINITLDELKKYYSPHCNTVIWPTSTGLRGDRWTKGFPEKKFKKDFIHAIIQYPESYITVRLRVIKCLLGITCNNASSGAHLTIPKFPKEHYLHEYARTIQPGKFMKYARAYHRITAKYFFKGWIYLLGCSLVFFLSSYLRIRNPHAYPLYTPMISLSGLLYWIPYLVVAPCSDFRYNGWMIMSCLLSSVLLVTSIRDVKKKRSASPQ